MLAPKEGPGQWRGVAAQQLVINAHIEDMQEVQKAPS